jgi:hypothetical protein
MHGRECTCKCWKRNGFRKICGICFHLIQLVTKESAWTYTDSKLTTILFMFAWVDTPILRCHGKRKVGLAPLFFVSHVGISYSHLRLFTGRSPLWLRLLRRSSTKRFSMRSCLKPFFKWKKRETRAFLRSYKLWLFQNGSDSSGGAYQTRPYFPHACYACHRWSVDFFVNICQYI